MAARFPALQPSPPAAPRDHSCVPRAASAGVAFFDPDSEPQVHPPPVPRWHRRNSLQVRRWSGGGELPPVVPRELRCCTMAGEMYRLSVRGMNEEVIQARAAQRARLAAEEQEERSALMRRRREKLDCEQEMLRVIVSLRSFLLHGGAAPVVPVRLRGSQRGVCCEARQELLRVEAQMRCVLRDAIRRYQSELVELGARQRIAAERAAFMRVAAAEQSTHGTEAVGWLVRQLCHTEAAARQQTAVQEAAQRRALLAAAAAFASAAASVDPGDPA
eukprot:TRINITY_DN28147_c0_g1_i1.p1 TRINITY_DN28147_c0_g1~~TRINITY_DN28147_c0_g1_i1.p1  ORF type:complete len:301 (+),score=104.56 TRINITY_DN28147_c0_g1_i1:84-905(+)